nr:unnamed protein product [Callosobruchus chinensis]
MLFMLNEKCQKNYTKKNHAITITCFQNYRYESSCEAPKTLLKKEFGDTWEEENDLKWYKRISEEKEHDTADTGSDKMENECDCLEEDIGAHI